MKKIRINSGIRRMEESDKSAALLKLRDILGEHRALLISRLVNNLTLYIDYRFHARPNARQTDEIRDALQILRNSVIDLDRYAPIVEHFLSHEMTFVNNTLFYQEIDDCIGASLNHAQLQLVVSA